MDYATARATAHAALGSQHLAAHYLAEGVYMFIDGRRTFHGAASARGALDQTLAIGFASAAVDMETMVPQDRQDHSSSSGLTAYGVGNHVH